MKSTRKEIVGLALLTSLSIFAGTATVPVTKTDQADTEKVTRSIPRKSVEKVTEIKDTVNGKIKEEIPKIDSKRTEELKTKLRSGRVTKEEAEEIIKIMETSTSETAVEGEIAAPKK